MVVICDKPYPKENEDKYKEHFGIFPYSLSDFQKYGIEAIVEGHHTLLTAHTGSGKTLPAEFAIRYFTSKGKKVIYTSPIKALSNQKYYDFTNKYTEISIGLMTGDIKTNPTADVLIMTTEIFMNYLFNTIGNETKDNSCLQFQIDVEKELACVIFDEAHYILDEQRGQIWEQTILMLPRHVQMVLLSATIDSPERFAKWCERGYDDKQVYLASTNHRVVPLTHYSYLTINESVLKGLKDKELEKQIRNSTNKLIRLQTEKGKFEDHGYNEVKRTLDIFQKRQVYMKRPHLLNNLTLFLREREMLPAICFIFSRKLVERCAHEVTMVLLEDDSKIPYIVRREAENIIRRLPNYQEYLNLPEYLDLISLLEKGIGIHHSGMIPVLREIVELFISKKYIKLLFATESFAIGLDCPIKTAIFISMTKFDGNNERYLMSHEYTQMAGRAGRRGIDTIGHVIHCNNLFRFPSINDYKSILCGKPQPLESKFHISYSVILNMLKQKAGFQEIYNFVEKSMIFEEINKSKRICMKEIEKLKERMETKLIVLKQMKTPEDICNRYLYIEETYKNTSNKQRKNMEKERNQLLNEYVSIVTDSKIYNEYKSIKDEMEGKENQMNYLDMFIKTQITKLCKIMNDRGYISIQEGEKYELNEKGVIAANIAEVHPLIMAHFMEKWNYFEEFSCLQLVGLFSCFTDIKIPKDYRRSIPSEKDVFLKEKMQEMKDMFIDFDTIEKDSGTETGIQYDSCMVFDITDESMEWCYCENEEDCKKFIQKTLFAKEISIGDFTKAILKISVIVKELMAVCELIGKVDLLHKLSQIDGMILKYITVNQSLYV
jgi:antiviral helicase SKI2